MVAQNTLLRSLQDSHRDLADRFGRARAMGTAPGQPRKGFERTDQFLAAASKHLNAVDAVLLPAARRELPDGGRQVHEYVRGVRHLEVALAQTKAREYGEAHAIWRPWPEVWADVETQLDAQARREQALASGLEHRLSDEDSDRLVEEMSAAEVTAPSRPHPYSPHTGVAGSVARRVLGVVDRFWDTAEGRMVPERRRPAKDTSGLLTQYLLGDPHLDGDRAPRR
jgi:hypothetical protein